ncbi:SDR family NAD(P)-dependent oxidoreductase [Burkholderia pyrrocinia]|uniref:SDR family NAD(P)-dependent oxidoreductase n=1 Tax=Burkholderia pyrrocinia TaxID=60550 RepID=UPI002AB0A1D1|nr:SDR family NAD(P)-dependent oxidoreductase [Burkholderia pyrrocinia]
MARIFITGSTDGLGRAAAATLVDEGHEVLLHARSQVRASAVGDLAGRAMGVIVGDLANSVDTRRIADRVNAMGRMDAVIHNAGAYLFGRNTTADGHSGTLAVNVLAPYLLTALIERPSRLIYLSSSMHRGVRSDLDDIDWLQRRWNSECAYSESKLHLTALALAAARHWPDVLSNAVDPGWVPTRMGGADAPDDLALGHLTQTWLAASDDSAAMTSGGYWHHRSLQEPAAEAADVQFQNDLMAALVELTGVKLF